MNEVKGFSDRTFLVTGATGFIGSCLARRLTELGAGVHIFARKQSNRWRIRNLQQISEHEVDLRDADVVQSAVSKIQPDVVFHLAAYGGYPFQGNIGEMVETNVQGTINMLTAMASLNYQCFVTAGSSSEYGTKPFAMTEVDLLEPINAYGVTKAAATLYSRYLARSTSRPISILRLFSPYGPYEEPSRLVPYAIKNCLTGQDLNLTSGTQVRDFVYIDDVVEAFLLVALNPPQPGEILNIGSGTQNTVREVVERIARLCGPKSRLHWGALAPRPFETTTWLADTSKARRLLGWRPRISLDEGLSRTIAWQQEQLAACSQYSPSVSSLGINTT
jgi:nucleoside-diphosphate-sugar epimerase